MYRTLTVAIVFVSFGVSASSDGTRFDYATVFAQADRALYEAKRDGRNRVCLATPAPPPAASELTSLNHMPREQWNLRGSKALGARRP